MSSDIVCFANRCINLASVKKIIFDKGATVLYVDGQKDVFTPKLAQALKKALQMKGVVIPND